jgi:hypothetical protein
MMKSYRTFLSVASLTMAVAITFGTAQSALAGPKPRSSKPFKVTGVIVAIDHDARTLKVRNFAEDQTTTVHVPEGLAVRLSRTGNPTGAPEYVYFEHAQRGQHVALSVKKTDTLAIAK